MPKTKFTALLDGQVIGTRTSDSRDYTHVIVGQRDIEAARRHAYGYQATKTDASNFRHYMSILDGTSEFLVKASWRTDAEHTAHCASMVESTERSLGGARTLEDYIAVLRNRAIASFEKAAQGGAFDMGALQWSMSEANARKAAASWSQRYLNVRVIPATKA